MENDNEQDAMKKGCTGEAVPTPFTNFHTNECHHTPTVKQHLK